MILAYLSPAAERLSKLNPKSEKHGLQADPGVDKNGQ